jgi:N-acetylglucosaminyldiphosphoundecaprenol N-acetyl-beta-D-mannosaminyltransferase
MQTATDRQPKGCGREPAQSGHRDYVFNDGTGVRWAARQRGIKLQDNLCGTDLIPDFLAATAFKGYRYFLLGATQKNDCRRGSRRAPPVSRLDDQHG